VKLLFRKIIKLYSLDQHTYLFVLLIYLWEKNLSYSSYVTRITSMKFVCTSHLWKSHLSGVSTFREHTSHTKDW